MSRVSMGRDLPPGPVSSENVFIKIVPTGNTHCEGLVLSMVFPAGSTMKRSFSRPSLQRGGSGTNLSIRAECCPRSGAFGKKPVSLIDLGTFARGLQSNIPIAAGPSHSDADDPSPA